MEKFQAWRTKSITVKLQLFWAKADPRENSVSGLLLQRGLYRTIEGWVYPETGRVSVTQKRWIYLKPYLVFKVTISSQNNEVENMHHLQGEMELSSVLPKLRLHEPGREGFSQPQKHGLHLLWWTESTLFNLSSHGSLPQTPSLPVSHSLGQIHAVFLKLGRLGVSSLRMVDHFRFRRIRFYTRLENLFCAILNTFLTRPRTLLSLLPVMTHPCGPCSVHLAGCASDSTPPSCLSFSLETSGFQEYFHSWDVFLSHSQASTSTDRPQMLILPSCSSLIIGICLSTWKYPQHVLQ